MLQSLLTAVRRSPRMSLLGVAVFLAITGKIAWQFLVLREPWQMLVDLDVYREAGLSVLSGRPVYEYLTPTPQLLPFTYPPVSAVLAIPLTLLPLQPMGWLWTAIQMVLLAAIVTVAFRPLLDRFGRYRPLALGVLAGLLFWTVPNKDGIMFGQVDIILVALCLADYVTRRPRWPRGMLVGIATAVKLTPGVFIAHMWLAGKRREALTAAGTAVALTLGTFLLIPGDSADFWFRALLDSDRLGSNAGTSNQAIRGWLMRFGPEAGLFWLPIVAVVAFVGFRYAVRCTRAGNDLAACAIVGLLAVLLSPVAWIHHLSWMVLSLAVIVGDGRDRRRVVLASCVTVFFILPIPWMGAAMADPSYVPQLPIILARIVQDGFGLATLLLLPVVARYGLADAAARSPEARQVHMPGGTPCHVPGGTPCDVSAVTSAHARPAAREG